MKNNLLKFVAVESFLLFCYGITRAEDVVLKSPIEGDLDVAGIIGKVTGFAFWLAIMICPIAIIWGGFEIATAGGDQAKITKGKQIITYSIVGLAIIALSNVLVSVIKSVL